MDRHAAIDMAWNAFLLGWLLGASFVGFGIMFSAKAKGR